MLNSYNSYLKAISFEFSQELLYKNLFNITGKSKYIPRSFVYKEIFIKYSSIINFLFWLLILIWTLFFLPLYNTYLFVKLTPRFLLSKKKKLHENIYIELSDIKYFTFINSQEKNYPTQKLTSPFYKTANRFNSNIDTIRLEEASSYYLFIISYLKSIFFPFLMLISNYRNKSLYSYTIFSYVLVYEVLTSNNIRFIWLTNHYDRWVVLSSTISSAKTSLVQHGQLDYFNVNDGKLYKSTFPFKLKNISTVYVQNEASINLYKDFVFEDGCTFKTVSSKVEFINWRYNLSDLKYKILFIGHTNDSLFHTKLISMLYLKYGEKIDIAYKYHPLQINQINNDSIWHITSGLIIPVPDLVVSYGSSIDAEFKSLNNVVVYNYAYEDNNNTTKVFDEICSLNIINTNSN